MQAQRTFTPDALDCLVIGGGPAGLTAVIYLARFRLRVLVIDEGKSRAALIPRTRNHAGYPGGIAGEDLPKRTQDQASEFEVKLEIGRVDRLQKDGKLFKAFVQGMELRATAV